MQSPGTDDIAALYATAYALWQQNQIVRAEAILHDLNARHPGNDDVAVLLASVLRAGGRLEAACQVLLGHCRTRGFPDDISLKGATFARQCGRHALATLICAGALATGQPSTQLLVLAGHVARESGNFERARECYLAALHGGVDLEREYVLAALANTRRYSDPADPDIALCERYFRDTGHSVRSRASAGFGLAKAQDDLGDYAAAARSLSEANALVRSVWPWNAELAQRTLAARGDEHVARARIESTEDFAPIFVVGLPRSGTTLTATLLAKAAGARDRGESRVLRYITEQLAGGGHFGSAEAMTEAAQLYRAQSRQDDAPAAWYIDQDPLNFRYLHIVAAMFPRARIIHCRRGRADTALSLWSQDFAHPEYAFAYDLRDIASYGLAHDDLMKKWHARLDLPVHELDYESLVADPDGTVAALCAFIGAPSTAVSAADGEPMPVQSASVWQVRQPVHSRSVGRWRAYAPHLPALEAINGSGLS